jgi:hypothetical protein
MSDWLDKKQQRIEDLAGEIDNLSWPVQYRAPVAELEQIAIDLALQVDLLKGYLKDLEWAPRGQECPACLADHFHSQPHEPDCFLAKALDA